MSTLGNNFHIMWREIIFIIVVIHMLRIVTDVYIAKEYKKILEDFLGNRRTGIEKRIEKCRKHSDFLSNGPWNKNNRWIYNNLCVMSASISYVEGDISNFFHNLNNIKKENEFEMKAFLLFLHYYSEGNKTEALKCYNMYLKTERKNEDTIVIIQKLMGANDNTLDKESFSKAVNNFRNPAILEMFDKIKIYDL